MSQKQTTTTTPSRPAPTGPRGLGGYCWALHPTTGVHCTEPVGHRHADHWHTYTKTRWT
jgi:hypothetical protein